MSFEATLPKDKMDHKNYTQNDDKPESKNKNDVTIAFLRAARNGDLYKIIQFLDSKQVDINCCNANGLNALHLAAKDGYTDIIEELLKRGICVDNATKKGNTALHIASLAGQSDVLKSLIQYNANVNVQSLNGFTPLYMAAQENHYECVRCLLDNGANPSVSTEDGFTPLAVAMQQGNENVVSILLEHDARGKARLPALHIAAKKNDVITVKSLLRNLKNPDVVSKSGFTPLHIAAHYGNVEVAGLLIDEGADVNFTAKHNITPLHVACKWGRKQMVIFLISKNADVFATTRDGLTPLHCAARSGHVDVIKILLTNNSSISSKTKNGLSALHMAAQGEHDEAARVLLYNDAKVDEVTTDSLTPLHVAAHCGHVRVAQTLLEYSADVNAKALNGFSPLHIACKKNRIKLVELLIKHSAEINAATESGLSPLHVASFMGAISIVMFLIQNGAGIDSITIRNETPLHLAVRAKQIDIIKILLQFGANVNAKAQDGQTPLHIAVRLDNSEVINILLFYKANVDSLTKDNYTPLHIAAKEGLSDPVLTLVQHGTDVNAKSKKGFSPIHLACKYGKLDIVKLLSSHKADINSKGKNDLTPLHLASHYGYVEIVNFLIENGASIKDYAKNGHTALHIATKKQNYEICEKLIEKGSKINSQCKNGITPLHIAVQNGNVELVKLFLKNDANVNLSSKNGLTPLHIAAQEDHPILASILLDYNASMSSQTCTGFTPMHIAAYHGQINVVKLLLERKANFNIPTFNGFTPLHHAAQQGHTLIINLLLRHNVNVNAVSKDGITPLMLAENFGYIVAADSLRSVTESSLKVINNSVNKISYNVPEVLQESFLSDSDDDLETSVDYQQYKYMAKETFKSSWEHDGRSNVNISRTKNNLCYASCIDHSSIIPINAVSNLGFLVSFLVDARGGSLRAARNPNVRILVPPKSCSQPTRITCRFVKVEKIQNPPVLMEGEALISRIMELSPVNMNFLGPVIFEIPHIGSLTNREREIVVLRSDNGIAWCEHLDDGTLSKMDHFAEEESSLKISLKGHRKVRIATNKMPYYFTIISRIKQETHIIGPDGGTITSEAVPSVSATFPQNALTKKIRVGLQAQSCCINNELLLGASPVVTIEPRRRKFHKAITLSIPGPLCVSDMNLESFNTSNLRLLCSISGGQNQSLWEDVTGSTPLTLINKNISFTTTVSARFWIINCKNPSDASNIASKLYSDMTRVPYIAKFVVFAKKLMENEYQLSVLCISDEKDERISYKQKYYKEIARSEEVEICENEEIFFTFKGNVKPVLKTTDNLKIIFKSFSENKKTFVIHIGNKEMDSRLDISVKEIKICSFNLSILSETTETFEKNVDFQTLNGFESLLSSDMCETAEFPLHDFCERLGPDWIKLANALHISSNDIELVRKEFPNNNKKQALIILRLWMLQNNTHEARNSIQKALYEVGRNDIIDKWIQNLDF